MKYLYIFFHLLFVISEAHAAASIEQLEKILAIQQAQIQILQKQFNQIGGRGSILLVKTVACPEGWRAFDEANGRYIAISTRDAIGAQIGTPLRSQENRTVGRHGHNYSDPGHSHTTLYLGSGGSQTLSGAAGGWNTLANTFFTSVASNVTGIKINEAGEIDGTNAPYINLLACEKL